MFQRRLKTPLLDEATSTLCTSDHDREWAAVVLDPGIQVFANARHSFAPSQADVAVFKALSSSPDAEKFPHAARWYSHISTFESEFATLPGDASKAFSAYGPEAGDLTLNPAKAPETAEDDDDVDLFGSDDEEEDAEAARVREERLEAYRKKKENKPKTIAKSVVTMDVKPWGKSLLITKGLELDANVCRR